MSKFVESQVGIEPKNKHFSIWCLIHVKFQYVFLKKNNFI